MLELDDLEDENLKRYFTQDGIFQYDCKFVLEKGNMFGELAFLEGTARQATIICKKDCYFATLTKK